MRPARANARLQVGGARSGSVSCSWRGDLTEEQIHVKHGGCSASGTRSVADGFAIASYRHYFGLHLKVPIITDTVFALWVLLSFAFTIIIGIQPFGQRYQSVSAAGDAGW